MAALTSIPTVECPRVVRKFCDDFKDILSTKGEYQSFVAFVCAAVFGIANISDIARYFLFSPSVSTMSLFLSGDGTAGTLNRRFRKIILKYMKRYESDPERYHLAIDDTIIPHYGLNIWGVYKWHDHKNNGYVNGHKLLVIGLVDRKRNVLIPLAWEILHRDLSSCAEDGSVAAAYVHEKAWETAIRLLDDLCEAGLPKLPLAADSWFHGEGFCSALVERGFTYIIECKSNRIVETHGRRSFGVGLEKFFDTCKRRLILWRGKSKFAAEAVVRLRNSLGSIKIIAVANRRNVDDRYFAYYACNQLTWDASRIWGYSRGRWSIEVQFRELKQLFALGGAAVRSQQSVETAVSISMIALTVIRLEQLANADPSKNQYAQPIPAGAIVRDLKLNSVSRCLLKLAISPQSTVQAKFHSRYNRQNLNRKPAERSVIHERQCG